MKNIEEMTLQELDREILNREEIMAELELEIDEYQTVINYKIAKLNHE